MAFLWNQKWLNKININKIGQDIINGAEAVTMLTPINNTHAAWLGDDNYTVQMTARE